MIKIIDDKGRLFGKINIIDFMVLIFLLSFVPMVFAGYKIINKRNSVSVVIPEKTWNRQASCKYCGYPIILTLKFGQAPLEEEVEVKCEQCGKGQKVNFGFYDIPKIEKIKYDELQNRVNNYFKNRPREKRYF